jgi:predicted nucleotidyltransferase
MKVRTAQELMVDNLLVKHRAGSHAYGTAIETSDEDFRGVFAADPVNVRTPFFPVYEAEDSAEEDTKFYELAHFMKLCIDCNPNIIETLWVDEEDILFRTEAYHWLRVHRHELLSSKIAFTTSGYAIAQLKRIKGHNKWINSPQPEDPPQPYQFVTMVQWFGKEKMMPRDFNIMDFNEGYLLVPYGDTLFGVYASDKHSTVTATGDLITQFDGDRTEFRAPLAIIKWNRDEYRTAKEKHHQYWTWKRNRNAVRGSLEEQFGYDTKHAMHLVRLLRMGVEALRDGVIVVRRPDADELLAIRDGAWTYDELIKYAEKMDKLVREFWYTKTALPKKPDIKFAARLLMEVQDKVWNNKNNDNKTTTTKKVV